MNECKESSWYVVVDKSGWYRALPEPNHAWFDFVNVICLCDSYKLACQEADKYNEIKEIVND